jgi:hypothetical protein
VYHEMKSMTFSPGDRILFKRGCRWKGEQLLITSSLRFESVLCTRRVRIWGNIHNHTPSDNGGGPVGEYFGDRGLSTPNEHMMAVYS